MIVGITGKAGCGKSTLAGYIQEEYFTITRAALINNGVNMPLSDGIAWLITCNKSPCVMSFADPIRDVAAAVFGSRYETQVQKASIDAWWEERIHGGVHPTKSMPILGDVSVTGRRILQFIGTDMFRNLVHPDIWLYAMERRLPRDPAVHVIIPDVRFENEADWIRARGGRVVHMTRTHGDALGAPVDTTYSHLSEAGVRMKALDRACFASTLDGLRNIAGDIVKDYLT